MDILTHELWGWDVGVIGLVAFCVICTIYSQASMKSKFVFRDLYFVNRIKGLLYLVFGPKIIGHAYKAAAGQTFKVSTPANDHLMVTSNELIRELIDAPLEKLSLHAVAKEILHPKHTMHGFEWQDQRGVEGTGFVRSLRSLLTAHLPQFQPDLEKIIGESLADELADTQTDGFVHARLFPLVKRTVTKVNCFIFFGRDLAQNAEFTAAALEFPQTVVFAAEFLRITPEFLRPLVATLTTSRHRAVKTLFRHLEPIVKRRLEIRGAGDSRSAVPADCIQWLIDTSPRKDPWSPARMVGEIMAVWFGSVHQLAMTTTYAVEDLCLHPEYVETLQYELRQQSIPARTSRNMESLPLLDSFVKESIRHSNSDAITGRRKALAPYTFQDGSKLSKGDWVCVPQQAMMHDSERYRDADTFDGFRFARANALLRQSLPTVDVPDRAESSLTGVSTEWPIWGFGNTACPGRFYASLVLKLILVRILEEWECRMPDPDAPRSRTWRSSIVPRNSTVVAFRSRQVDKSPT